MDYVRDWIRYLQGEPLGSVYSTDGWVMPLTHTDVAWMCKALAGESSGVLGPPSDAVAWAMIQYCYARRDDTWERRGGGWTIRPPFSLSEVLLFYCQPINPYWRDRGDRWAQQRRKKFAYMTPGQCEREYPGLIRRVLDLFRGKIDGRRYTGLVEFMKAGLGEGTHGSEHVTFGGNWFWKAMGSGRWEPGRVQVSSPASQPWSRFLVPVVMEAAAGAAVVVGPKVALGALALPFIPP